MRTYNWLLDLGIKGGSGESLNAVGQEKKGEKLVIAKIGNSFK